MTKTLEEQTAEMLEGKTFIPRRKIALMLHRWQERCEKVETREKAWKAECGCYKAGYKSAEETVEYQVIREDKLREQNTALQQRVDGMREALARIAIQNAGTPVAWFNEYAKQALADEMPFERSELRIKPQSSSAYPAIPEEIPSASGQQPL